MTNSCRSQWVAGLNNVLCIAFNSKLSVDDNPLLLENRSPQENRAISHFIDVTIPPDFALCIGVILARTSSKDFFDAIKARCCPGNHFQKLKVVRDLLGVLIEKGAGHPQSNTTIILTLRRAFSMFKKLGVDADELEGLLAQPVCHAPPNVGQVAFDQLVTVEILAKGDKKPSLTFIGQVIMNALQKNADSGQRPSPFVYCVRFGGSCFHCGHPGHWQADCPHTKGFANPNPRPPSPGPSLPVRQGTPEQQLQPKPASHYQREQVSQVKFVEHDTANRVLIDFGVYIHLSGSHHFTTTMQDIPPFHIFFADSNSSMTISQMTTLKLPVKNRFVIIHDVPFSQKISGQYFKKRMENLHDQALKKLVSNRGGEFLNNQFKKLSEDGSVGKHHFPSISIFHGLVKTHFQGAIDSLVLVKDVSIPEHLGQALLGQHHKNWRQACVANLDQMATMDVWEVLEKKLGMKTIGHRGDFAIKKNVNGRVDHFKARLVAHGDRQRRRVDCAEMYVPTASLMSLCLVLATAALRSWRVASFDVSGAYLYSLVEETVLIEPPVDFLPEVWGKALHLKKALYGMQQAGWCWWKFLSGILSRMGFVATEISDFKTILCAKLDIKWSNEVQQIVGLKCTIGEGEVPIAQRHLTNSILNAYPRRVLWQDSPLPTLPVGSLLPDEAILDPTPFQSVIGSLAYLVSGSRPDLAFTMNYLAPHSMGPTAAHWDLLDHVIGYLLKTRHCGIHLRPGTLSLSLWRDAGSGGDL
ncbi:hypothetical protein O181_034503 [Austropuccinia psidii MF-1]|uniref:CCHC-type domain-containing protein n=1 Tax=Austropuccinia psidii MF-1 TaxID=1389203 RepID=A0A9Q3D5L5_9BASI|nr:hypothetical protein [Austropuccinia psidii MF-1]